MTLTRREKVMITAGVIIVSLTAYIVYFLLPTIEGTNNANIRLIEAQSKVNQYNYMAEQATKLENEIKALDGQLAADAAAIPKGVSHARILQYLKLVTDGKSEELEITLPGQPVTQGSFLLQAATLDFRTSYEDYIAILAALKQNKLYSRATFVQAVYLPVETETPQPTPESTATGAAQTAGPEANAPATAAPAPVVDGNVLKVRIELNFYALGPEAGGRAEQPMEATLGDRVAELFPNE